MCALLDQLPTDRTSGFSLTAWRIECVSVTVLFSLTILIKLYKKTLHADDQYNIPKGVDCTEELNNWVYSGVQRLQSTPYSKLPELVRRFTHDIYLCVYIY